MTEHDALTTHLRDELGITELLAARPLQAALASAVSCAVGAALPLLVALASPASMVAWTVAVATVLALACLGGMSASVGDALVTTGATRVAFWGVIAMAVTSLIGWFFGVSVA